MIKNIIKTAIILAALFAGTAQISAQTIDSTDPFSYKRGATYEESVLPSTPQASSIVKFSKTPFSYSAGAAEVDIPFYTLKGKEFNLPIGLHYTSGIKLDEIAGIAGLGWTLNAGGCITRMVSDMPDEFNSPYMEHLMPSGSLFSDLKSNVNTTSTLSYLQRVCTHKVDARLDRYSYNACGLSGSFVIIEGDVVQLSGDGVLLDYTCTGNKADYKEGGALYGQSPEVLSFIVIGPDGSVLTFSEREIGQHDGTGFNPSQSPLTGEKDLWSATTAWFLSSIKSASGLEEAIFTYKDGLQWDRSVITHSQTKTSMTTASDQVPLSSTVNTISQQYSTKLLTSISLNGYKVELDYTERKSKTYHDNTTEWNFPASLSSITIKAPNNTPLKSVNVETAQEPYDGRIILKSLSFKDSSGTTDDVWDFQYHTLNRQVSHLEQDWFGYYNGRKNTSNNGICPFSYSPTSNGTYGEPWSKRACYMSLAEMNHDGEKTSFEYGYYRLADVKERFSGSPVVKITTSSAAINGDESTIKKLVRSFSYSDDFSDGPVEPVQNMYTTTRAPYSQSDMFTPRESITWSFTLHESPVGSGPSIRDTKTYYGKVIEEVSDGNLSSSLKTKTIRYYNTDGLRKKTTSVFGRFPSAAKNNYKRYPPYDITLDPYIGIQSSYTESGPLGSPLLTREEEYAFDEKSNTYKIISGVNYTYAEKREEQKILMGYEASQAWYPSGVGNCPYEYIYHYPVYASTYGGRVLFL